MPVVRIATWNLQHASSSGPDPARQIARLRIFNPDIAVLTETDDAVDLGPYGYHCAPTQKNCYGKYCSVIWSKYPIAETHSTEDPQTTVCAQLETPLGPLLVYGTIITYRDDGVGAGGKKPWAEHLAAIAAQGKEWHRLLTETCRAIPLCVAGDFNQTRDGSYRYATKANVKALDEQLTACGLACLTEEDFGAAGMLKDDPRKGYPRSNIDHVCITSGFSIHAEANAWDHFTEDGEYLSDHNGVYVDFF